MDTGGIKSHWSAANPTDETSLMEAPSFPENNIPIMKAVVAERARVEVHLAIQWAVHVVVVGHVGIPKDSH